MPDLYTTTVTSAAPRWRPPGAPSAMVGTHLNMLARQTSQAPPALPPPAQPAPWADASTPRDWKAIAAHVAACLQPALGKLPRVELVEDTELTGPLFLNMRIDDGSSASANLQGRCNQADVVIVHDKLDALVVAPSLHTVKAMREKLEKIGFPDAVAGPQRVESMSSAEEAWLFKSTSKDACPNHGSSHTGVTRFVASRLSVTLSGAPRPHLHHPHPPLPILVLSDFGIHDGQVSGNAFNSTFILTPDPCLNPSLALTSNPQTLAVLYPRLASLAHVHQRLRLDRH